MQYFHQINLIFRQYNLEIFTYHGKQNECKCERLKKKHSESIPYNSLKAKGGKEAGKQKKRLSNLVVIWIMIFNPLYHCVTYLQHREKS